MTTPIGDQKLKKFIVSAMSEVCYVIDGIRPYWLVSATPLRWLGCPRGLALWSSNLDEKWNTGVWEKPTL
jgi:hypothetical protein